MTKYQLGQSLIDEAVTGIAWFAVWKESRSWCYWVTYNVSCDDDGRLTIDGDYDNTVFWLEDILSRDPNAVFLNGYHTNLGSPEDMTIRTLADALDWQYRECGNQLRGAIECIKYWHSRGL